MFQQFTGSTIKLEKKCQVSFLKGQRLLPTLQHANVWAFVGFNCLVVGRQPLSTGIFGHPKHRDRSSSSAGRNLLWHPLLCNWGVPSRFWGDIVLPWELHCLPMHFHPPTAGHAAPLLSLVPGDKQLPLGIVLSSREKKWLFFGLQFASQMDQSRDLNPNVEWWCQHSECHCFLQSWMDPAVPWTGLGLSQNRAVLAPKDTN